MVVAIILVATRMAVSTAALPGRSRCRPAHVAVTVLAVWLAVSWPCFAALPTTNRRFSTRRTTHSAPRTCMSRGDGIATERAPQPPTVQILASPRRYTWTRCLTPCGARRCTWQRSMGSQLRCWP